MTKLEEFIHSVPSLDAYPRARFFYRNLKSLVPRFKRVAGSLPKCFHNTSLNDELDDLLQQMERGVEVNVIGDTDIDSSELVISVNVQETGPTSLTPQIVVFVIRTAGDTDTEGHWMSNIIRRRKLDWNNCFLILETPSLSGTQCEELKHDTLKKLLHLGMKIPSTNLIVETLADINIAQQISDFLEALLIKGYVEILGHLDEFVIDKSANKHNEVFTHDDIIQRLREIYNNKHILSDLMCSANTCSEIETGKLQSESDNQRVKHKMNILSSVLLVMKCMLVPTLASKYNMTVQNSNILICHLNLENRLSGEIDLKTDTDDEQFVKNIVNVIESRPAIMSEIENEFIKTRRGLVIMRKMKYEVHAYLKQTKVSVSCSTRPVAPKIPDELREAILSVEGVFGMGTYYGEIEVHLESSSNDGENNVEADVRQLMDKYRYGQPYIIKHVTKKPKPMEFDLDPGNELVARIGSCTNGGTLGGYIMDRKHNVYALTCEHVVGKTGNAKVFVRKPGGGPSPLSMTQYTFSDGELPLIDIAAAQLIGSVTQPCFKYLVNSHSPVLSVRISDETPEELVGTKVVKIGAATGKSYGCIASVDSALFGRRSGGYLMYIDPMPDMPEEGLITDPESANTDSRNGYRLNTGDNLDELETVIASEEIVGEHGSSMDIKTTCLSKTSEHFVGALSVFVRHPNEFLEEPSNDGKFATRGDSGSIVCASELAGNSVEYTAVSMISHGELTSRENPDFTDDEKTLSFKILTGLEKLAERSHINW